MFRCLKDGAEEFLLKPIRLADVRRLKASASVRLRKQMRMQEQEQEQEQPTVGQCNKRKFSNADGFKAESPERGRGLRFIKVA